MFQARIVLPRLRLSLDTLAVLFQQVLRREMPADDEELSEAECMTVWICDLLAALPQTVLSPMSLISLVGYLREPLAKYAEEYVAAPAEELPSFAVAVADGRHATWTGNVGWVDLKTMRRLVLPNTPVESLAYNVGELFRRHRSMCQAALKREQEDATNKQSAQTAVS